MTHIDKTERTLFFKSFLKSPKSLGAIVPSSKRLARSVARQLPFSKDSFIVEIGAGTGSLTKGLLNAGYKNIIVVEIDAQLCCFLKKRFPGVTIIHADACHLFDVLPKDWIKKVDVVVSGIPMINFSKDFQKLIINSCFSVMSENGCFLQFTYGFTSPISFKSMDLEAHRLDYVFLNLPPAVIWRYRRYSPLQDTFLREKKSPFTERVKKIQSHFSKGGRFHVFNKK